MAKGRFNIKGTKDFLVAAVACAFFFLWFLRDGWFPPERVLKDHPLEMALSMKVSGVIKSLPVAPGTEVGGPVVLAEIYDGAYKKIASEAEAAFDKARELRDPAVMEKRAAMLEAQANVEACSLRCSDFTQKTSHGEDKLRGKVLAYHVEVSDQIEAGETILTVRPKDGYYLFNQASCILSFIGLLVSLFFHRVASR